MLNNYRKLKIQNHFVSVALVVVMMLAGVFMTTQGYAFASDPNCDAIRRSIAAETESYKGYMNKAAKAEEQIKTLQTKLDQLKKDKVDADKALMDARAKTAKDQADYKAASSLAAKERANAQLKSDEAKELDAGKKVTQLQADINNTLYDLDRAERVRDFYRKQSRIPLNNIEKFNKELDGCMKWEHISSKPETPMGGGNNPSGPVLPPPSIPKEIQRRCEEANPEAMRQINELRNQAAKLQAEAAESRKAANGQANRAQMYSELAKERLQAAKEAAAEAAKLPEGNARRAFLERAAKSTQEAARQLQIQAENAREDANRQTQEAREKESEAKQLLDKAKQLEIKVLEGCEKSLRNFNERSVPMTTSCPSCPFPNSNERKP